MFLHLPNCAKELLCTYKYGHVTKTLLRNTRGLKRRTPKLEGRTRGYLQFSGDLYNSEAGDVVVQGSSFQGIQGDRDEKTLSSLFSFATSPTTLHLLFLEPPQAIGTGPGYLCTEESNYN